MLTEIAGKVDLYIRQHRMIEAGDHVFIGLSGGADSVCLLLVLKEIRDSRAQEDRFSLSAVHVNHMLRGEESEADEEFVRGLCRREEIPLAVHRADVDALAAERHIGTEEAGRLARREVWRQHLDGVPAGRIALAHQKNDLAETFLFHAARGTSLAGLASIRPVNGRLIRPVLCLERAETEAYLAQRGISWRTDSTNSALRYTRNAVRHQVLPALEASVNTCAGEHIAALAEDLRQTEELLREETERLFAQTAAEEKDGSLWIRSELTGALPVLQGRVLLEALARLAGGRKDLGRAQVRDLQRLLGGRTGSRISLPMGIAAERRYGGILLYREADRKRSGERQPEEVPVTGPGIYHFAGWEFTAEILSGESQPAADAVPRKTYTKWLDYDKIKRGLSLRTRRSGDRITVNACGGHRKLKDHMIDAKIPRAERDAVPLLASGSEVYWIVGERISESCRVTEETETILKITAKRSVS